MRNKPSDKIYMVYVRLADDKEHEFSVDGTPNLIALARILEASFLVKQFYVRDDFTEKPVKIDNYLKWQINFSSPRKKPDV